MLRTTDLSESTASKPATVSRSIVVAARLFLMVAAAVAGGVAVVIAFRDGSAEVTGARYGCPMHPEVRSGRPGQCPICGMALELNGKDPTARSGGGGAMPGMTDLSGVENVRKHKVLDFVRLRALSVEVRELRGAAWVEPNGTISAVFYRDQADVITVDDTATFSPTQAADSVVPLQLITSGKEPWDRATSRLHFVSKAAGAKQAQAQLTPGQIGWVEVPRKPRNVLTVPADAILESPEGPYVLRALGGFRFEKRPIEVAETFSKQGVAVVLSGLTSQDRVVARATFFLDAERRVESQNAEQDWGAP